MKSPLVEDLGYLAETQKAEQVLEGSYQPMQKVDQYALELLHELQLPECVRKKGLIYIKITPEEHVRGWKKTKEKSAEPSGPSMAEIKAVSQDKILAEIDTFMRNLPYVKGFARRAGNSLQMLKY
jgi:hypothetical protein